MRFVLAGISDRLPSALKLLLQSRARTASSERSVRRSKRLIEASQRLCARCRESAHFP